MKVQIQYHPIHGMPFAVQHRILNCLTMEEAYNVDLVDSFLHRFCLRFKSALKMQNLVENIREWRVRMQNAQNASEVTDKFRSWLNFCHNEMRNIFGQSYSFDKIENQT